MGDLRGYDLRILKKRFLEINTLNQNNENFD